MRQDQCSQRHRFTLRSRKACIKYWNFIQTWHLIIRFRIMGIGAWVRPLLRESNIVLDSTWTDTCSNISNKDDTENNIILWTGSIVWTRISYKIDDYATLKKGAQHVIIVQEKPIMSGPDTKEKKVQGNNNNNNKKCANWKEWTETWTPYPTWQWGPSSPCARAFETNE